VLRKILQPKRGKMTGDWRKLHEMRSFMIYAVQQISGLTNQRE
jgi:hypothetical protein